MKKLIFLLAICFGLFVSQSVVAQSAIKVNGTPQNASAISNGTTTNLNDLAVSGSVEVTKSSNILTNQFQLKSTSSTENVINNDDILEKKNKLDVLRSSDNNLVIDPTKINSQPLIISPN